MKERVSHTTIVSAIDEYRRYEAIPPYDDVRAELDSEWLAPISLLQTDLQTFSDMAGFALSAATATSSDTSLLHALEVVQDNFVRMSHDIGDALACNDVIVLRRTLKNAFAQIVLIRIHSLTEDFFEHRPQAEHLLLNIVLRLERLLVSTSFV